MPLNLEPTPAEVKRVDDLFVDQRMRFLYDNLFFGVLLLSLQGVATGLEVKIGAVNYRNLYLHAIDPERVPDLDEEGKPVVKGVPFWLLNEIGRVTLLAHELGHVIFEHLTIPRDFDKDISNIAQDAVINRWLDKEPGFSLAALPDGVVTPIKGYNGSTGFSIGAGPEKQIFTIPDFDNKDWVPIYWDIMQQLEKNSGGDREKLASLIASLAGSNPMQGDTPGIDESTADGDIEFEQDRAKFRQKLIAAYETAKQQGHEPKGLERVIANLQEGKVHWTTFLRRLIRTEIERNDFSSKPNSRRAHLGGKSRPCVFPRIENPAIKDIVLALDTSGSMSAEDIAEGLSEFASLRQCTPFRLFFISCDATAYDVIVYERHEEPEWDKLIPKGGGGTNFNPIFERVEILKEEASLRPALLVYFTDTFGAFPEEAPDYPVVWVCNHPKGAVPWGDFVSTIE